MRPEPPPGRLPGALYRGSRGGSQEADAALGLAAWPAILRALGLT